jgi:hypothetical protein
MNFIRPSALVRIQTAQQVVAAMSVDQNAGGFNDHALDAWAQADYLMTTMPPGLRNELEKADARWEAEMKADYSKVMLVPNDHPLAVTQVTR